MFSIQMIKVLTMYYTLGCPDKNTSYLYSEYKRMIPYRSITIGTMELKKTLLDVEEHRRYCIHYTWKLI